MLKLTNELAKEGVIDQKTRQYLQNIDKGIKTLNTKIKK